MEREFVPFETAKKLRAIGFDESCCAFYEAERGAARPEMVDDTDQYRMSGWRTCKNSEVPEHYFAAATFSQAFRWLREKHEIYYTIEGSKKFGFQHFIYDEKESYEIKSEETFKNYGEAELDCLEKLIGIAFNMNKEEVKMTDKQKKINSITIDIKEYFNEYPPENDYHRENVLGWFSSIIQELDVDVAISVMENLGDIGKEIALEIKQHYGY